MSDYIAEVGDRVRVTIEGVVEKVNRFDTVQEIRVALPREGDYAWFDTDMAQIERVV